LFIPEMCLGVPPRKRNHRERRTKYKRKMTRQSCGEKSWVGVLLLACLSIPSGTTGVNYDDLGKSDAQYGATEQQTVVKIN